MGDHGPVPPRRTPFVPFPIVAGILALGAVVAVVFVALGGDDGGPTAEPSGSPSVSTPADPECEDARQEMVGLYETARADELEYIALIREVEGGTPAQELAVEIRASTDAISASYRAFDGYDPPGPLQDDRQAIRPSLREFQALADRETAALIGQGESPGEAIAERLQNLYDVQPDPGSIVCD